MPEVQPTAENRTAKGKRRMESRRLFGVADDVQEGRGRVAEAAEDRLGEENRGCIGESVEEAASVSEEKVENKRLQPFVGLHGGIPDDNHKAANVGAEMRKRTNKSQEATKKAAGAKELMLLIKQQQYACAICRRRLTPDGAELDHKTPVSDGGDHGIDNLQWLCCDCNRAKGNMSMAAFTAMCERIVRNLHGN